MRARKNVLVKKKERNQPKINCKNLNVCWIIRGDVVDCRREYGISVDNSLTGY